MHRFLYAAALLVSFSSCLRADPLRVRASQGTSRGFLIIRTETGDVLGYGDAVQIAHGTRVTSRVTYHFRDGSLDDETTVFTQNRVFRLVTDHHVQRGPFFKEDVDISVDSAGTVLTRSKEKDGKIKVETHHVDLPDDLSNGLVGTQLLNVSPHTPEFTVHYLAASGKGRMVTLHIAPEGEGRFGLAGLKQTATIFRIHPDVHGIAGVIAPLVGKQPEDLKVWIVPGPAPMVVREICQLAVDTPTLSIELTGGRFDLLKPGK